MMPLWPGVVTGWINPSPRYIKITGLLGAANSKLLNMSNEMSESITTHDLINDPKEDARLRKAKIPRELDIIMLRYRSYRWHFVQDL